MMFHQLSLQRRTVINRAPTGMADCDKSCHNAENSLYPNIAGKRHEGDGLKAQKQLAQGNALGSVLQGKRPEGAKASTTQ